MENDIEIISLSKTYRLGHINHGMLYKDLQSAWARFRGKEDPNLPIETPRIDKKGNFLALDDLNFSVKRGEVLGIVGRNGAGKSTLLKILSRITAPTRGEVRLRGRIASLLEVGTGFHPELTGRENIFLNGAILGMPKKEVQRKLSEIIDFAEVGIHIDTPVKRYSSGMYIRLAFAVAAFLESEILIVDEVLAVGDLAFQKKCLGKMKDIGEAGRTVLFVSHNIPSIRRLCTRTVVLDHGKLAFDGSTSAAIEHYTNRVTRNPAADNFQILKPEKKKSGAQFLRAHSLNKANEVKIVFDISEEIIILVEYLIFPETKGLIVPNLHFLSEDGVYLFTTSALVTEDVRPGKYTAQCNLPGNFLNTGNFSVRIAITQYVDDKTIVLVDEQDYMYITIEESPEFTRRKDRYNFGAEYPGFLRPILDWKITEVGQ